MTRTGAAPCAAALGCPRPPSPGWRRSSPRRPPARAPAAAPASRRTDSRVRARSAKQRSPPTGARRQVARRTRQPPFRAASAASRSSPARRRAARGTPRPIRRGSATSTRAAPAAAAPARVPEPPPHPARRRTRHAALASSLGRRADSGTPTAALRPVPFASAGPADLAATSRPPPCRNEEIVISAPRTSRGYGPSRAALQVARRVVYGLRSSLVDARARDEAGRGSSSRRGSEQAARGGSL